MKNLTNTMGKKLLHTFGYDAEMNLVPISQADKNKIYTCPKCGERIIVRNNGKNQRPHFAHFKKPKIKCNGTSLIRHIYRIKATEILNLCIKHQQPFTMEWQCPYCSKIYNKDILQQIHTIENKKTVDGHCIDIALLDSQKRIRIAIEILVQRKLKGRIFKMYEENGIILIQLIIKENDIQHVENKLHHPDSVAFCGNNECYNFQFCQHCFNREIFHQQFKCKKCGKIVDGYMVRNTSAFGIIGLDNLSDKEKQDIINRYFIGKRATQANIVVYGKCRCIPHSKGLICLTKSDSIKETQKGKITKNKH